jgi:polyribonucleotide nucleotidyltransferase
MQRKYKSVVIGEGKELLFETGKIAKQAAGAVIVRMGDTMVFAAATVAKTVSEETDFFPLRVDYQEKFSSAGKSLGGFIKREGRASEKEILISRLIDRPLRPMFPDGYYNEVQILSYVWSYDGANLPDPLAICAASASLVISEIPLIKPIAAVRVGLIGDKFIINPTLTEANESKLDLVLAGTEDAILMIEGYCDFLTEEQVLEAIRTGHEAIAKITAALNAWGREVGKTKNIEGLRLIPEALLKTIESKTEKKLSAALEILKKQERDDRIDLIEKEILAELIKEESYTEILIRAAFKKIRAKYMREMILSKKVRSDGRSTTQIRPIDIEHEILPRAHGSCLFTRGETQTLAVCTLGGESMGQRFEDLNSEGLARFYLQYFFPPFSVGEVGRSGPAGRREVGHGKLAERALKATMPSLEEFPYTVRLESNITESNGSSSMASVCGGCLAMMDAGVPIKRPVSGIAMGLILEGERVAILSDILGIEDALGDMDFKITGDAEGITAFQMDIKIEGITLEIMKHALMQAKEGRIHILQEMLKILPKPKVDLSLFAPRIETMQIKPSKIGGVIGPGGKQIRKIVEETGVQIDISDSGLISIASTNPDSMRKAKSIIEGLVGEVEIGKTYEGKVTSVVQFGAFIEILPGKEGLCHISELSDARVDDIFGFIKEGDVISVKVLDINERGQIKLSRKALLVK